jgi:transcriptional regulator with XRE-family HTH domain
MARAVDPLLRNIGVTIRTLRHERGLSQEMLAQLARIDRSYMSGIERGLRNVSVLNVARIAAALDVPVRDLLGAPAVGRPYRGKRPAPQPAFGGVTGWAPGGYLSLS